MRSTAVSVIAVGILVVSLGAACQAEEIGASAPVQPEEFAAATFEASTSPSKAVLTISLRAGYGGSKIRGRAVLVYGDGRTVITDRAKGLSREVKLSRDELQAILKTAVSHGLAEWDGETLRARSIAASGSPYLGRIDGTRVRVELVLTTYRRGPVEGPVAASIELVSPDLAVQLLPEIAEYRGVEHLRAWATDLYERVFP